MQRPTDFYEEACSTSVGGDSGATCAKTDTGGESRAQVRVDLTPEVDGALQDKWLDAAHAAGHVADEVVAVGLRHDIAIQVASLDEVVILRMKRVRGPDHLTRFHQPRWIAVAVAVGRG